MTLSVTVGAADDASVSRRPSRSIPSHGTAERHVADGSAPYNVTQAKVGLGAMGIAPKADIAPSPHDPDQSREGATRFEAPHTWAKDGFTEERQRIARVTGGGRAMVEGLAGEAPEQFDSRHRDARLNNGQDRASDLPCWLTPGSYVVSRTHVAARRCARVLPQEPDSVTADGDCKGITRQDGGVLPWDSAHPLKAGFGPAWRSPSPRPVSRVVVGAVTEPIRPTPKAPRSHYPLKARSTPTPNAAPLAGGIQ
ncbi:hypothetical protein JANAI62_11110 [Jannaschia pagri]|uniref:Uncharacterized protein n=1 Tax=Jannaschia pagri TaxID=2829797 RepID=A0ABQ4NJ89_9RHOB|nr:hypothetical protein JANAI61_11140 [Jannaschia sp. AI_61]GIT94488.1 hypothetical protein JANAI62_11110 [Jannaschia sp. AI_62]